MKITDIVVNPDNLAEWDFSTEPVRFGCATLSARMLDSKGFDDCLNAHMSLNEFIDTTLNITDGGGQYANWLNSLGFDHQSDNGWWNEISVSPENIEIFVQTFVDSELDSQVNLAKERFNRKRFKHDFTLVSDFLEVFG